MRFSKSCQKRLKTTMLEDWPRRVSNRHGILLSSDFKFSGHIIANAVEFNPLRCIGIAVCAVLVRTDSSSGRSVNTLKRRETECCDVRILQGIASKSGMRVGSPSSPSGISLSRARVNNTRYEFSVNDAKLLIRLDGAL